MEMSDQTAFAQMQAQLMHARLTQAALHQRIIELECMLKLQQTQNLVMAGIAPNANLAGLWQGIGCPSDMIQDNSMAKRLLKRGDPGRKLLDDNIHRLKNFTEDAKERLKQLKHSIRPKRKDQRFLSALYVFVGWVGR